jgi:hypothetical protein
MSEEGRSNYYRHENRGFGLTQDELELIEKGSKPIKDMNNEPKSKVVKTDKEDFDLTQIPFSSLERLGKIFREGELKYGKDNWRNGVGNKEYQLERANHAIKHLYLYIERLKYKDKNYEIYEDDLAKVMWFCATQIELERLKN